MLKAAQRRSRATERRRHWQRDRDPHCADKDKQLTPVEVTMKVSRNYSYASVAIR